MVSKFLRFVWKTQQRFSYKSSPRIQNPTFPKASSQGTGPFDGSSDLRLDLFSRLLQNIKRDMKIFFLIIGFFSFFVIVHVAQSINGEYCMLFLF